MVTQTNLFGPDEEPKRTLRGGKTPMFNKNGKYNVTHDMAAYSRAWRARTGYKSKGPQTPEQKAQRKKYQDEYNRRPEVLERKKIRKRKLAEDPAYRQMRKEKHAAYHQKRLETDPEYREKYEQGRAWNYKNPKGIFYTTGRGKKKGYRLKQPEFVEKLKAQNGCCARCNTQMTGILEPMIDHDHKTGKVRDLLCNECNTALGFFEKHRDEIDEFLAYLDRHACQTDRQLTK